MTQLDNLRQTDRAPLAPPTAMRWRIFALACGTSWILYLHRYVFALIKPELASRWGIDETTLGAMDSAFYVGYLGFQIPAGLLCDMLGTHLFLSSIIVGWSALLAMHVWAPTVSIMLGVRFCFGAFQAGAYPALSKVTGAWFPRSIRTTLQGWIASFFGRLGGGSANLIFAMLMIGLFGLGWQLAVLLVASAGIVLGVLFLAWFRNTPAEHPGTNEAERRLIAELPNDEVRAAETAQVAAPAPGRIADLWRAMSLRSARNLGFILLQHFAACFSDAVYATWLPFFLREVHGLEYAEMGLYSALPLLGGACGGILGGYLNDTLIRVTRSRRWARTAVGAGGNGTACALVFLALASYEHPYAFCWILMFAKFFSDWGQPTVWGTITDVAQRQTATVFGVVNGVGGIGGLVAPVILGSVAQYYSWPYVFNLVGAFYLVGAVSWLFVNCTIPVDDRATTD